MVARGALIRAGAKWLDYCSCPVNVAVITLGENLAGYIEHSVFRPNFIGKASILGSTRLGAVADLILNSNCLC